jgi:putative ABC transport system permease protein
VGTFLQNVIFSHRFLCRRPGFTLMAALTIALGIGANTAVFTVVHALLIQPLPLDEPERLVAIHEKDLVRGITYDACSARMFLAMREQNDVLAQLAGWYERTTNVVNADATLQVQAWQTTSDFFPAMGLQPILGRGFHPNETLIGNPGNVVVLGNRFWREQFGSDRKAVGRTILVDDLPATIVGIMAPNEQWLDVDLLMPLPPYVTNQLDRRIISVVGRLKPGQTLETAQARLQRIAAGVHPEFRTEQSEMSVALIPIDRMLINPNARLIIGILSGAVVFVMLIACVNLANLLLARAVGRRREIAIHAALGAGRFILVRRLLTESIMVTMLGGAMGVLLALWGVDVLRRMSAGHIPRLDSMGMHGMALVFTAALAFVSGIAAGLFPAIPASRTINVEALKETTESGFGRPERGGLRGTLVVVEVALALALLISAGLLLRSAARVSRVDPGFQTSSRLAVTVNLPRTRYEPDAKVIQFWRSLLEQVRTLPGIISATGTSDRWLEGQRVMEFDVENQADTALRVPIASVRTVTPGYFRTLGIRILDGRDFNDDDWRTIDGTMPGGAPFVTLVSQSLAEKLWPGERAIGKRIRPVVGNDRPWCTVIGVVNDVRQGSLTELPRPFFYLPEFQFAWTRMFLVAHVSTDMDAVLPAIQAAVSSLDRNVPVNEVVSLDNLRIDSRYVPRAVTLLIVIFAILAAALAAVGVYGLVAYSVARRTHEFGVRIALGAGSTDIVRLVVRQGLKLILAGEAAGLLLALMLTSTLGGQLYEISPADPMTYTIIAIFLLLVALAACVVPAWRATRVNPARALRTE